MWYFLKLESLGLMASLGLLGGFGLMEAEDRGLRVNFGLCILMFVTLSLPPKCQGNAFLSMWHFFVVFPLLKLSQEVFGLHNGKTTAGWLVIHQKGS